MSEQTYRHEYKYLVSAAQVEILKNRAAAIMQRDTHVCSEGKYAGAYNIRSLYFDDFYNTAYWEIESGTDPREKFRIRIYNRNDGRISLELKQKQAGKCRKFRCPLTREQCEILISGDCLPENKEYPPVLQKLLVQIRLRQLHPVVVVEYDRIPYVYPIGNVRVTLDLNTRCSCQCERFLEEDLLFRPIFPTGQHILEVKWDELLPDHIYQAMMLENLQWSSFSKFYYGRRFLTDNTKCL